MVRACVQYVFFPRFTKLNDIKSIFMSKWKTLHKHESVKKLVDFTAWKRDTWRLWSYHLHFEESFINFYSSQKVMIPSEPSCITFSKKKRGKTHRKLTRKAGGKYKAPHEQQLKKNAKHWGFYEHAKKSSFGKKTHGTQARRLQLSSRSIKNHLPSFNSFHPPIFHFSPSSSSNLSSLFSLSPRKSLIW